MYFGGSSEFSRLCLRFDDLFVVAIAFRVVVSLCELGFVIVYNGVIFGGLRYYMFVVVLRVVGFAVSLRWALFVFVGLGVPWTWISD